MFFAENVPSILRLGLSTQFSVRGGKKIYCSQHYSHSVTYCLSSPKHLFLSLVLLNRSQQLTYAPQPAVHRLHLVVPGHEPGLLALTHR